MEQDMSAAIEAQKLIVRRAGKNVIDQVSFRIHPGRLTGLIGPSGSGKTTLMRTIVGVQKIRKGELWVGGLPAGRKKLRQKIGYVTQAPAVYDDLTVLQNLRYFGAIAKVDMCRVDDVLAMVQLEPEKHQVAQTLSGGQKARVSLAVALLDEPDVLVLDEPTVGLDPLLRRDLWKIFRSLADSGKTVFVSSHVMDEAERCDDIVLLRKGKLLWHGTKKDLLLHTKTKTVEKAFIARVEDGA